MTGFCLVVILTEGKDLYISLTNGVGGEVSGISSFSIPCFSDEPLTPHSTLLTPNSTLHSPLYFAVAPIACAQTPASVSSARTWRRASMKRPSALV